MDDSSRRHAQFHGASNDQRATVLVTQSPPVRDVAEPLLRVNRKWLDFEDGRGGPCSQFRPEQTNGLGVQIEFWLLVGRKSRNPYSRQAGQLHLKSGWRGIWWPDDMRRTRCCQNGRKRYEQQSKHRASFPARPICTTRASGDPLYDVRRVTNHRYQ